MRRLILTAALLAALAAAVPAQGATVRVQRFTGFDDVPIVNSPLHYRLRLSYVVPATWHQRGRAHGLFRRFGPIGSRRLTLRVVPAGPGGVGGAGGGPRGGGRAGSRAASSASCLGQGAGSSTPVRAATAPGASSGPPDRRG